MVSLESFALPYLTLLSTLAKEGRKEGRTGQETKGSVS